MSSGNLSPNQNMWFFAAMALVSALWGLKMLLAPPPVLQQAEGTVESASVTCTDCGGTKHVRYFLNFTLRNQVGRFVVPIDLMHQAAVLHPGERVKILFLPSPPQAEVVWGLTVDDAVLMIPTDVASHNRQYAFGLIGLATMCGLFALVWQQKGRK